MSPRICFYLFKLIHIKLCFLYDLIRYMFLMLFKCYLFNYLNNAKMLFKINYIQVHMNIEEITKVRNQGEISLITTIPKTYVKALNIEYGDKIEWILNTETESLNLKICKNDE